MVIIIGAGSAVGSHIADNPWQMSVVVGVAAAALSWVVLRRMSSER
ncbi:hypothetical protein [Brevundimonas sp. LjRoot202]